VFRIFFFSINIKMSDALILSGTPASVPSALASSLPSGSKIQSSRTGFSTGTNTFAILYPVPFSSATQSVTATMYTETGNIVGVCNVSAITSTGFSVTVTVTSGSGSYQVNWVAIGN